MKWGAFSTPGDLPSMYLETSLAIQWLKFHISTLGGMGAVPGWGAKIPHTRWQGKKKKNLSCILF